MRLPYIPPKRTGVDLSHIHLGAGGVRYADIAELKKRPEVQKQLEAIREARRLAKEKSGGG